MQWNQNTQSYRGVTSDGKTIDVTADEYQENLEDGIKALSGVDDVSTLSADDVEKYSLEVFKEIDSVEAWAALVGDNQNVTCLEDNEAMYREGRY